MAIQNLFSNAPYRRGTVNQLNSMHMVPHGGVLDCNSCTKTHSARHGPNTPHPKVEAFLPPRLNLCTCTITSCCQVQCARGVESTQYSEIARENASMHGSLSSTPRYTTNQGAPRLKGNVHCFGGLVLHVSVSWEEPINVCDCCSMSSERLLYCFLFTRYIFLVVCVSPPVESGKHHHSS